MILCLPSLCSFPKTPSGGLFGGAQARTLFLKDTAVSGKEQFKHWWFRASGRQELKLTTRFGILGSRDWVSRLDCRGGICCRWRWNRGEVVPKCRSVRPDLRTNIAMGLWSSTWACPCNPETCVASDCHCFLNSPNKSCCCAIGEL